MSKLHIPATERSPEIDFDIAEARLSFRGESYPEDASAFFGPVFSAIDSALAGSRTVNVDFELAYFNSSSAKAIMNIFQKLELAAQAGTAVSIEWRYPADDETMKEFGEDFSEDLEHVNFTLVPTEG